MGEVIFSKTTCRLGMVRVRPKRMIITQANVRRVPEGIFNRETSEVNNRVKIVKLPMKPIITPTGRFFPPILPERTTGKTGKIQGERMVTMPDKKANSSSINIMGSYYLKYLKRLLVTNN